MIVGIDELAQSNTHQATTARRFSRNAVCVLASLNDPVPQLLSDGTPTWRTCARHWWSSTAIAMAKEPRGCHRMRWAQNRKGCERLNGYDRKLMAR